MSKQSIKQIIKSIQSTAKDCGHHPNNKEVKDFLVKKFPTMVKRKLSSEEARPLFKAAMYKWD